ncbi:hypothetical protein WA026_023533 [Henosepilachna vigintioctopunctata]|uniref:MADF domain-containing protein n=1 Tax=Henosepilachna vigintioctopunctata TaxID=420089 RepID=A0AAW1TTM0_9CUCU
MYNTERRKTRWFCNMPLSPVEQKCQSDSLHKRTEEKIPECDESDVFEEIQNADDENISSSTDVDYFPPNSNGSSGPSIISETDEDSDPSRFKMRVSVLKKKEIPLVPSVSVNEGASTSTFLDEKVSVNEFTSTSTFLDEKVSVNEGASTSALLDENQAEGTLYYGKRLRQKDFCFFCESLVQCFARHVIRNHTTEIEVQRIISYPPKNPKRMKLIADLRKKGNFVNSGTVQKAVKKGVVQKGLLPCSDCLGFYNKAQLWRHRKYYCKKVTSTTTQADAQNFMIRNLKIDDELKKRVFPRMRADMISMTAKSDPLRTTSSMGQFGSNYKLKNKRHDSLMEIAVSFGIEILEIERKWKNLTSHFWREKKKENETKTTGSGADEPYTSKWFAYQLMMFLGDKNKPRNTQDSGQRKQEISL